MDLNFITLFTIFKYIKSVPLVHFDSKQKPLVNVSCLLGYYSKTYYFLIFFLDVCLSSILFSGDFKNYVRWTQRWFLLLVTGFRFLLNEWLLLPFKYINLIPVLIMPFKRGSGDTDVMEMTFYIEHYIPLCIITLESFSLLHHLLRCCSLPSYLFHNASLLVFQLLIAAPFSKRIGGDFNAVLTIEMQKL